MKTYQNPNTEAMSLTASMTTMQSVSSNLIKGIIIPDTTPEAQ